MHFHHIGVAVQDPQAARGAMLELGGGKLIRGPVYDPEQDATLSLHELFGLRVELVSGEAVKSFLKDRGWAIYHFCYEVDTANPWLTMEWTQVTAHRPAVLFGGRRVAFFAHKDFPMIELLEI